MLLHFFWIAGMCAWLVGLAFVSAIAALAARNGGVTEPSNDRWNCRRSSERSLRSLLLDPLAAQLLALYGPTHRDSSMCTDMTFAQAN
jgi:hypothetical protein